MRSFDLASQRLPQICTLSLVSVLLSGCALGTFQSGDSFSDPTSTPAYTLSGTVHTPTPAPSGSKVRPHISFPAAGATVFLYAAGTSGYGSAATLLAQTTTATDGSGSFSFIQNSSHTNSLGSLSNTYSCPSYTFNSPDGTTHITKDAYIYVVAFGGDTQNNYDATSAQTNTGYALMAALGDCTNAGSLFVDVNEVTTVASVFALAPYISPIYPTATINSVSTTLVGGALGTSTSYMTAYGAGTNGGYTSTGTKKASAITPLGYTGMVNAFATVNNLVNLASGTANGAFNTSTTFGSNTVTVTATPEQAKLNQIADILAYCVDSSNSGTSTVSTQCSTVFGYAKPPISSATTSLGTGVTFPAATDTLQTAYYLATNPTNNSTYGTTTTGTSSNLYNLFSLVTANADYQPTLSAPPSDWTLSIAYSSSSTCGTDTAGTTYSGTGPFIGSQPYAAATDLSGNVAMINGQTVSGSAPNEQYDTLVEFSNLGAPINCMLGSEGGLRSVFFDGYGNLWASANGNNAGLYQSAQGASAAIAPTKWATTTTPYAATSDGKGNVFYTSLGSSSLYSGLSEFVGAQATTTPVTATQVGGTLGSAGVTGGSTSATNDLYYLAADASGDIWSPDASATSGVEVWAPYNGSYVATEIVHTASYYITYGAAVDSAGNFVSGNTCCSTSYASGEVSKTTAPTFTSGVAGSTTGTHSATNFTSGILGVRSVALDGAGNIWIGVLQAAAPVGTSTTSGIWGVAEEDASFDSLSPNPTSSTCASTSYFTCEIGGGYEKTSLGLSMGLAIDISGNVWVPSDLSHNASSTSDLVEIIGAAVPTVPLAVAARDSKLATKP